MKNLFVVFQEKPQLENQRSELLESIAADLQFLRDLEDKSLSLLQKTEGDYLKIFKYPLGNLNPLPCLWKLWALSSSIKGKKLIVIIQN